MFPCRFNDLPLRTGARYGAVVGRDGLGKEGDAEQLGVERKQHDHRKHRDERDN